MLFDQPRQVAGDQFDAPGLRARPQQHLPEFEIGRDGAQHEAQIGLVRVGRLCLGLDGAGVFLLQRNRLAHLLWRHGAKIFVLEILDLAAQEAALHIDSQHREAALPDRQQVHSSVLELAQNAFDGGGAASVEDALSRLSTTPNSPSAAITSCIISL